MGGIHPPLEAVFAKGVTACQRDWVEKDFVTNGTYQIVSEVGDCFGERQRYGGSLLFGLFLFETEFFQLVLEGRPLGVGNEFSSQNGILESSQARRFGILCFFGFAILVRIIYIAIVVVIKRRPGCSLSFLFHNTIIVVGIV